MTTDHQILMKTGMRFIEVLSASAMHELKNKLAIINENSGLIQDLSWMAQKKEQPLDIGRMETISGKIQKQVLLADAMVRKVNRFSESMADDETDIDLAETLSFVLDFADRLIEKRQCRVQLVPPSSPVMAKTRQFYFENLFWLIINSVCIAAGPDTLVSVTVEQEQDVPQLLIHSDAENCKISGDTFADKEILNLVHFLGVCLEAVDDSNSVRLVLNKR